MVGTISPERLESRNAQQQQLLHTSLVPVGVFSRTLQSMMTPTLHGPSPLPYNPASSLPNALQPVPSPNPAKPVVIPNSRASFEIIINSPPNGLTNSTLNRLSATTKKSGRPLKGSQAVAAQKPAKKKGRPFKAPEAAAAARRECGSSTDNTSKKRGRFYKHPRGPEHLIPVVFPEAKFIPFICEWKSCPAELHNLDTLRAHLDTVHLKKQLAAGQLMCLWKKCCREHTNIDPNGTPKVPWQGLEFDTQEELRNHVKVAHLDVIARWQGDGPRTELSFYEKPPPAIHYSFRCGGPEGQVTPSVRNQPVEDGYAKVNNLARFHREREGPFIVYKPLQNPELYMKDDNNQHQGGNAFVNEP